MDKVKHTQSFCPTCYKRIPATVDIEDGKVRMHKLCTCGQETCSIVEADPDYYLKCLGTPLIYNGYFIDVTKRCNLKCKTCYYPTSAQKDVSAESILQDAMMHSSAAPVILTGGEPTLRNDLDEIIASIQKACRVELVTNGTELKDSTVDLLQDLDGIYRVNLSMHPESNGADYEVIERFRKSGKRLESVLCVIDDLSQIDAVLDLCDKYADVIAAVRIKAATNLWNETKARKHIFVSDMLKYLQTKCKPEFVWWRNNKTSFLNLMVGPVMVMLVSWYNVHNIDVFDINCPPFYRAKNGQIVNIVTSFIINEGMQKGWLDGNRIGKDNG